MTFTVKIVILAAVALAELVVAAVVAPRFSAKGQVAGVLAILGSAIGTVGVVAYVLFVVLE